MSAVDFVDNTADLMYIGAYLSRMGLDERALQVYRQAASLDPLRPEPYMLGLQAARAHQQPRRIEVGKPRHSQPGLAEGTGQRLGDGHGRGEGGAG